MLGTQLKKLRARSGMTQEQLARKAGIQTIHLSRIERGIISDPRLSTLRAICSALGTTLDRLVASAH